MKKISFYIKLAEKNGFKLVKIIDLSPVNHQYNSIYVFKKFMDINYKSIELQ